jgi:hypothetical protein
VAASESTGDSTDNIPGSFLRELSKVYPGKQFFRTNGDRVNPYAMNNSTRLYKVTKAQRDIVWVTPVEDDSPLEDDLLENDLDW